MLMSIVAAVMTMAMFTSCSEEDNSPVLTPEEQLKAETFEKIKGIRSDAAFEELGVGRQFQFNEDDTYFCTTFYHSDNDGDGFMDEDENISFFTKGTWKALGNTYCKQAGESYDAVAVEYQTVAIVETPSFRTVAQEDPTVYRDTLYIVPNPQEGVNFIFLTDFVRMELLFGQDETKAATRSAWDWFKRGFQKIEEGLDKAWKWVKKAVADVYTPKVTGESDWMGNIFKDVNPKIHEISLPGTHDSFTYGVGKVEGNWGKTQVFDLKQQFDAGVRYFDFRLGVSIPTPGDISGDSYLGFYHSGLYCCVALEPVMETLKDLLTKHPGETVVAMLKFEYQGTTQTQIDMLNEELKPYKDILVDPSKYGPDLRLNDCRGKIVLMQRFSESSFYDADFGIYCGGEDENQIRENRYGDKKWKVMEQDLCECDIDSDDLVEVQGKKVLWPLFFSYRKWLLEDNFKDAANTPADRPDTWHINKTSGYTKRLAIAMSYAESASYMNKYAYNYISEHLGEKTGWVIMDFAALDIEGAFTSKVVYGDDLIRILLKNNKEMVKKGVLK